MALLTGDAWPVQDLSHLKFDAYDADFNRTLAAAKTLSSLDEVRTFCFTPEHLEL